MVYLWPLFHKITAIAKKELFYAMPFGMTAWLCGTRFINRSNPDQAKASMNAALDYVKEKSVSYKFVENIYNSGCFMHHIDLAIHCNICFHPAQLRCATGKCEGLVLNWKIL